MKRVALCILDGWGVAPLSAGNAIGRAQTPNWDEILKHYPSAVLEASGEAVGLPYGEMGNSEVGHLTMGIGRIYYQALPRISKSIADGSFFNAKALVDQFRTISQHASALHCIGLVSTGGIHSSLDHLFALLTAARQAGIKRVFVHAIVDGRDSPFNSGANFLERIEERLQLFTQGTIATICGRFWAMDRDRHWERTEQAYRAMVEGKSANTYASSQWAMREYYNRGVYDEMIPPTVLLGSDSKPRATIEDQDGVIFFNFRPDRMRQLAGAFVIPNFTEFTRARVVTQTVTLTNYDATFPVSVVFPSQEIKSCIAKIVSEQGGRQVHIAETEKYAHVTYFFNAQREEAYSGEERILVPSQRVTSYDQVPEMSSPHITSTFKSVMSRPDPPECIIVNYANADMVAHTGNFEATRRAVQHLDTALGEIVSAALSNNYRLIITSDHGNAEEMIDATTGQKDTQHSRNPVPFVLIDPDREVVSTTLSLEQSRPIGGLSDIAPTLLTLMDLPIAPDMTGKNLLPLV